MSQYSPDRRVCCLCAIGLLSLLLRSSTAADFYFSASGNDQTGTGTLLNPWRSITKFNSLDLEPGDQAFFEAGETFMGSIIMDPSDSGTDLLGNLVVPIRVSSYGGGAGDRAIIRSAPASAAFLSRNNGGIELSNLEFRNGGTGSSNTASGIQFQLDGNLPGSPSQVQHLRIDNVISQGFRRSGLSLQSTTNSGYANVQIKNSEFFNNQFAGIEIGASQWTDLVHHGIAIDNTFVHNNTGFAGCSPHCGHGIVLGQVDGAVVENSVAHSNGLVAGRGNVGIWAWQSNDVVIQKNFAYGNRSPNGGDGGGFDLDGGVTNSVVQYNTSEDNGGAGYLLAQFAFAEAMEHNTFRYNLSVNDGTDDYGGITVWGEDSSSRATSALFHNNTVIVDKNIAPNARGAVSFLNGNHHDIDFINNLFVSLGGAGLIDGPLSLLRAQFANNAYWTNGDAIQIGDQIYSSIAEWASATQQETLDGEFVGVESDPLLDWIGGFGPQSGSPLIDRGLQADHSAWPTWWTGLGPTDVYGTTIPHGAVADIGAVEHVQLPGDFNFDGQVDAADYVLWRHLSQSIGDYIDWRTNFGSSSGLGVGTGASRTVPEPCAICVLVIVGGILLIQRRRFDRTATTLCFVNA